jgi:hypothetical protein
MPEGLLIAGGIVGLVGGTIGAVSGGWSLAGRIATAWRARKERIASEKVDIRDTYY